jgi:lysyl-tRNA synthetase class 2
MDDVRFKKAQALRAKGKQPYAGVFERTHTLQEARSLSEESPLAVAGRIVLLRDMGKMTFITLQDHTGRMQIAFKQDVMGEDAYKEALNVLDLGDFIGVHGTRFTTQKGEPSALASQWEMLSKALRQPPEKWHGVSDQETLWRQRYLDLMTNRETFDRFIFRSRFVQKLREFYWKKGFIEVETPVLTNAASGALATPFVTHHQAYDLDVYLRIAPETYLKECIVGGYDKVFEVARVFRNEGLDPSHLQDFTMVEHYCAYWDYVKNMDFTEELLATLMQELTGSMKVQIPDRDGKLVEVDFTPPWPKRTIRDAILQNCGIDINISNSQLALIKAIKSNTISLDAPMESLGFGNLVDQLYKKIARPLLVHPTFIIQHPIELSPLARRNDQNPAITDRFQLVVGGWEIVNAYSELVDPVDQKSRFDEQEKAQKKGDTEAHKKDDDFVTALEYGCPPCSGWGMGIDRIVALLTQQPNLRDVVLFPLMKPLGSKLEASEPSASSSHRSSGAKEQVLLPPQHLEYGHLLGPATGLLEKHTENTKAHLIATGAAMEALSHRFNGDPATWRVAGMLHDLDWDNLQKDAEKHCGTTLEQMLKEIASPKELLDDIRSHYASKYGADYPLNSWLRKCLYCCDELTGFIIAVTLVRPSKKLADVEVKSVKKKFKEKGFAAQVDRKQIESCEELLGIPLDEFIGIVLNAMKPHAEEIGL